MSTTPPDSARENSDLSHITPPLPQRRALLTAAGAVAAATGILAAGARPAHAADPNSEVTMSMGTVKASGPIRGRRAEQQAAAWQKFQDRVATGPVDHDVYQMSTTELVIEQDMSRRLSATELHRPCTREWRRALATLLLQRTDPPPAKAKRKRKRNRHQKSAIHSRTFGEGH